MNIKKLDSNALKLIAILAMTVDHAAWLLFPGYPTDILPVLLHIVGRITCPIMCYFIAEGYHYTRNINKYTVRLFVFAIVSHFAYVFASSSFVDWKSFIPFYYGEVFNQTSVIWPLGWGLVMLRVANSKKIKNVWIKTLFMALICLITFPSDWSCVASLCVFAIGVNRGDFKKQMTWMSFFVLTYAIVYFFAINKVYGIVQMGVVFSIPLLMLYNGERGKNVKINKFMKWFFYLYYPLHLFVIGFIGLYLN